MTSEQRAVSKSQWVLEAKGAGGEAVPPSVLAEWQRYQKSSRAARRLHSLIEAASLVVTATIPALAVFAPDARLVAAVGSLAVLVNGLRALGGFKENWTSRTRARYAIEREIALFAVHHGRYGEPGAAVALVEAVEQICATEREGWAALRLAYGGVPQKPKGS
ncbi:DUF4231 domain-containing protein [Kutzneria sp. CA-103260]|uniref:DUF4231 domain-containing protein n=1 Tax=Kutzneria sp. CA-103260 TaxID=2802641 RepID=UPI001BADC83A|nr:DUF4231 domain-containing protein [Kutzneria sp. CA-103260]